MSEIPLEKTDIHERELAAERRSELEELERFLGELAQIAHSINNPLTALLGRAQLLAIRKELDPKAAKAAEVIETSAQRVAEHVKQLAHVVRTRRQEVVKLLEADSPRDEAVSSDGA